MVSPYGKTLGRTSEGQKGSLSHGKSNNLHSQDSRGCGVLRGECMIKSAREEAGRGKKSGFVTLYQAAFQYADSAKLSRSGQKAEHPRIRSKAGPLLREKNEEGPLRRGGCEGSEEEKLSDK